MNPDKIESHIDKRIFTHFSEGLGINEVIDVLKDNIRSFSSRDSFIKVKKRYLINNWSLITPRKKYTTYCVMHYSKRVNDLKWLIEKKNELTKNYCILSDINLFNLILLKDKLSIKYNPISSKKVLSKEEEETEIYFARNFSELNKPDLENDNVSILWKHWNGGW
jgi:hypothetical protein